MYIYIYKKTPKIQVAQLYQAAVFHCSQEYSTPGIEAELFYL